MRNLHNIKLELDTNDTHRSTYRFISQPWDDDTEIPAESNPEAEFENNTPLQESTDNPESIVENLEQEPDELTFTDQL